MVMTHKLTLMILGISTVFRLHILRFSIFTFLRNQPPRPLCGLPKSSYSGFYSLTLLSNHNHIYTPLELAANLHDFFYSPFSNRRHSPHSRNSQTPLWLARILVFRFLFSCPTLLPYHIYTPLELAANLHDFFYSPFSNRHHSPYSRNSQPPLWLARIPIFRFLFSCPTLLPYHIYTLLELAANLLQLYPHPFSIPPRNPHSFPVYTQ